jgi:hypothetical protein
VSVIRLRIRCNVFQVYSQCQVNPHGNTFIWSVYINCTPPFCSSLKLAVHFKNLANSYPQASTNQESFNPDLVYIQQLYRTIQYLTQLVNSQGFTLFAQLFDLAIMRIRFMHYNCLINDSVALSMFNHLSHNRCCVQHFISCQF